MMFQTDFRLLYIHTYGQTLLEIAGMKAGDGEVTGNSLVELPAFTSVMYNSKNTITEFVPYSMSL